ncbi:uncharacterized protein ARB_03751 [Trichophyton benhamiae CBS 112371]|uniref:Uncharacterized protein n=1 Tax=Arthroderma benhamiae (strain ATCC MYA-4681 / CBS 112371) TaxID=663331 RepID=D4B5L1_ARTBC|nr:uncharacterized protein ARB_03751 [Trichophyton benhamiae CBS 112371]EFE29372.1 hypothetical protein ARB_03751 [Trichophyton benhamiae CBS 112371]
MAGVLLGDGGRGSIAGGYLWDVLEQTDQTDPGAGPGPGRELLDILGGATELLVLYGLTPCVVTEPASYQDEMIVDDGTHLANLQAFLLLLTS